jgi:hypothetical protein
VYSEKPSDAQKRLIVVVPISEQNNVVKIPCYPDNIIVLSDNVIMLSDNVIMLS